MDPRHKWTTIKLLEENMEENLCELGLSKDFLAMTPKAQSMKAKKGKLYFAKLKQFAAQKIASGG